MSTLPEEVERAYRWASEVIGRGEQLVALSDFFQPNDKHQVFAMPLQSPEQKDKVERFLRKTIHENPDIYKVVLVMEYWSTERRLGQPDRRTEEVVITVHEDQKPSYAYVSEIVRKDPQRPKLMPPVGPVTMVRKGTRFGDLFYNREAQPDWSPEDDEAQGTPLPNPEDN
jgi:hypothetical protein